MKRKVIQIANSTQLISLPRKWSQTYGIKKGEEVDVEEQGDRLIIRTESRLKPSQVELNPPHLKNITERYVTSCYRDGASEIKVICDPDDLADLMEHTRLKMHDQTIGYELISQGKNFFIIKDLSGGPPSGFESALRRTFILLVTSSQDILEAFKNRDEKRLRNAHTVDRSINKLTNLCSRYLLTKGLEGTKETIYYYHFLRSLESLADQYSLMAVNYSHTLGEINNDLLDAFQKINQVLHEFYEVFYKYDKNRLNNLFTELKAIEPERLLKLKISNASSMPIVYFLNTIHRRLKELIDSLIDINLGSEINRQHT